MADKKTNTIKRFLTSKHTQSQEQIDKVRFTGPVLEQPQPSHNPLPDGSGGNFGDSIDLNRILAQGVGSEGQGSELNKPLRIKRIDQKINDEDMADMLEMVKARKKVRTKKERKEKEEEKERCKKMQ